MKVKKRAKLQNAAPFWQFCGCRWPKQTSVPMWTKQDKNYMRVKSKEISDLIRGDYHEFVEVNNENTGKKVSCKRI